MNNNTIASEFITAIKNYKVDNNDFNLKLILSVIQEKQKENSDITQKVSEQLSNFLYQYDRLQMMQQKLTKGQNEALQLTFTHIDMDFSITPRQNSGINLLMLVIETSPESISGLITSEKDIQQGFYIKNRYYSVLDFCIDINDYKHFEYFANQNININTADYYGTSLLHKSITASDDKYLKCLLEMEHINIDIQDVDGYTPLMDLINTSQISEKEKFKRIECILKKDASLTIQNKNNRNVLDEAKLMNDGSYEMIKSISEYNKIPNSNQKKKKGKKSVL